VSALAGASSRACFLRESNNKRSRTATSSFVSRLALQRIRSGSCTILSPARPFESAVIHGRLVICALHFSLPRRFSECRIFFRESEKSSRFMKLRLAQSSGCRLPQTLAFADDSLVSVKPSNDAVSPSEEKNRMVFRVAAPLRCAPTNNFSITWLHEYDVCLYAIVRMRALRQSATKG